MAHTIEQILEIEPRLKEVIELAQRPEQKERMWYNVYHDCKMRFQELVGYFCRKPELQNSKDYEAFVMYIVDIIYANSKDDSEDDNEQIERDY
jgi:hypothetical protein